MYSLTNSTNHIGFSCEAVHVPSQQLLAAGWASIMASVRGHPQPMQIAITTASWTHVSVARGSFVISLKGRGGKGTKGAKGDS